MTPLSPLFLIIIYLISFLVGYLIHLKYKIVSSVGRYESIDGLRGFLALGVFIHHANIWYSYIRNGTWGGPSSTVYLHLGSTSVAFFFMITSFLFISKLINSDKKEFNWRNYFMSRIYRLVPMYWVTISILIILVMMLSHWELQVGVFKFIRSIFHWLFFRIIVNPEINNSDLTSIITAGVTWSLPFEWLFYFVLPLIALLFLQKKVSWIYILLGIIFIFIFSYNHILKNPDILSFVGGAFAPFILKYTSLKKYADNVFVSILVLICTFLFLQFDNTDSIICKILVTMVFTSVALGNTFFGIFKNNTLKFLGEISYSTYLLHGIILFITFYFIIGMDNAKALTPLKFSIVIFSITPIVIILSFLGFKFIEKPFMDRHKNK